MASKRLDVEDLIGIALLGYFGPMALGLATYTINVFCGFDFTRVLWSGSGAEISVASLLALAGVAEIVVTRIDGDAVVVDAEHENGSIVLTIQSDVYKSATVSAVPATDSVVPPV